jgi:hypothetical protein
MDVAGELIGSQPMSAVGAIRLSQLSGRTGVGGEICHGTGCPRAVLARCSVRVAQNRGRIAGPRGEGGSAFASRPRGCDYGQRPPVQIWKSFNSIVKLEPAEPFMYKPGSIQSMTSSGTSVNCACKVPSNQTWKYCPW